jgi:hypothetical protein
MPSCLTCALWTRRSQMASAMVGSARISCQFPRWTPQNRPDVDRSKPARSGARTGEI